jgi:hypothetical protein
MQVERKFSGLPPETWSLTMNQKESSGDAALIAIHSENDHM